MDEIKNDLVKLPKIREGATHVWHLFVVQTDNREKFQKYLSDNNIGSVIHYPIPPHLSEAYEYLNIEEGSLPITESYAKRVLSIPIYNGMEDEEIDYLIEVINNYC